MPTTELDEGATMSGRTAETMIGIRIQPFHRASAAAASGDRDWPLPTCVSTPVATAVILPRGLRGTVERRGRPGRRWGMLPRPVEVLHEGCWLPGSLLAVRRERDGRWRGLVSYTDRAAVVG